MMNIYFENEALNKFIVLEGPDGCGSTTQARLLLEAFLAKNIRCDLSSEPTMGPVGNLIRLAMSHRLVLSNDPHVEDRLLAYLFATDRYDHLHNEVNGILNLINKGWVVISTRYSLSSYAYHCHNQDDFEAIYLLNKDFPQPSLTFYLDCPIDVCLERMSRNRFLMEKYETKDKLGLVVNNYEKILKAYKGKLFRIDASKEIKTQHREILKIALNELCQK